MLRMPPLVSPSQVSSGAIKRERMMYRLGERGAYDIPSHQASRYFSCLHAHHSKIIDTVEGKLNQFSKIFKLNFVSLTGSGNTKHCCEKYPCSAYELSLKL